MFRLAGPDTVRLDIQGEGIEMDCTDFTHVRGQVFVVTGDTTALVVGFKFHCHPQGIGRPLENGTADRLTGLTGSGTISSTAIDVRGFARVRMEVVTATASTGALGIFSMCAYTPNTAFGELRYGSGGGSAPGGSAPGGGNGGGGSGGIPPVGGD